jgi:hypothetical protein
MTMPSQTGAAKPSGMKKAAKRAALCRSGRAQKRCTMFTDAALESLPGLSLMP